MESLVYKLRCGCAYIPHNANDGAVDPVSTCSDHAALAIAFAIRSERACREVEPVHQWAPRHVAGAVWSTAQIPPGKREE